MTTEAGWIITYTGRKFWPLNPSPYDIDIVDIAHALSNICRFTGHVSRFISVAQHSVMVSDLCLNHQLFGLLHDASEAYLCDIASPIKHDPVFAPYRKAETKLQRMIIEKFGLIWKGIPPYEVSCVDEMIGASEGRALMPQHKGTFWYDDCNLFSLNISDALIPWFPQRAEEEFLERFSRLYSSTNTTW